MPLPTGLIKSHEGTSQVIPRVKQGAESSRPPSGCLTRIYPCVCVYGGGGFCARQNNTSCCEDLHSRANSARFRERASRLIQTTRAPRAPGTTGAPRRTQLAGDARVCGLIQDLASVADNGKRPLSVYDHPSACFASGSCQNRYIRL